MRLRLQTVGIPQPDPQQTGPRLLPDCLAPAVSWQNESKDSSSTILDLCLGFLLLLLLLLLGWGFLFLIS